MADTIDILKLAVAKAGERKEPGYGPGMRVLTGEKGISVSTKSDEIDPETNKPKKIAKTFDAYLPGDLNTAVEVLGEKVVFGYFINALVVDLQASERAKLTPATAEGGRKKAKYLEELGL